MLTCSLFTRFQTPLRHDLCQWTPMTESKVIDFQNDTCRILYACGTVRYTLRNPPPSLSSDQSQQVPISILGVKGITHICATNDAIMRARLSHRRGIKQLIPRHIHFLHHGIHPFRFPLFLQSAWYSLRYAAVLRDVVKFVRKWYICPGAATTEAAMMIKMIIHFNNYIDNNNNINTKLFLDALYCTRWRSRASCSN